MMFNQIVVVIFLCGISLHNVLGQLDVIGETPPGSQTPQEEAEAVEDAGTVTVNAEDPEDENDVRISLESVDSIEGFLGLLRRNGQPVTERDIYDEMVDENGKQVINGGGRLAVPDNCSPRNTTIRITMQGTDTDVAFFPRCTKIERCGGCCPSPHLECIPLYTERVSLKVLKGRIPFPGAPYLDYTGFAPVILDRHVTCRVACTLTADRCGPKKRFLQQQCACKCNRITPCRPPTTWDSDDCMCKCPQVTNCCPNGDNCGMVFNPYTCTCDLQDGRVSISINSNASASGSVSDAENAATTTTSTTTTTPTTSTTTTTAAPTTQFDPCLLRECPSIFMKVRRGDRCVCQPRRSVPRGSRNRGRGRFRG